MSIVYLRAHRRRPVWVGVRPAMEDWQGAIPVGWCERCGMECYQVGSALCQDCERSQGIGKEYDNDNETDSFKEKSL